MQQSTTFAQVATNLLNVLQGYSKTIRLLLVMFLTLTASTAWGAYGYTGAGTFTKQNSVDGDGYYVFVLTQGALTTTCSSNYITPNATYKGSEESLSNVVCSSVFQVTNYDATDKDYHILTNNETYLYSSGSGKITYSDTNTQTWKTESSKLKSTSGTTVYMGCINSKFRPYTSSSTNATSFVCVYKLQEVNVEYSITLSENGKTKTETITSASYQLPTELSVGSCDSKTFVGWTTTENFTSAKTPTSGDYYEKGETISISGDETFYAVFANVEISPGETTTEWVETEIASIASNDEVVITMSKSETTWALRDDNGTSKAPIAEIVTIENGQVTSTIVDDMIWIIEKNSNNLTFYKDNAKNDWLYCTDTNNGVRVGTNTNKVFTISGYYLKHTATDRYVGVYRTTPDWRCYDNTTGNIADQTLAFYKKTTTTTSTETITNYTTSCTTQPSKLATPTELNVANITSISATLSWNKVTNAENYAIIIKKGDEKVKDITTGGTTCNVTELDANTEYTGCVYAVATGYTNSEETCVTFTTAPAAKVVNWNVKGTEHQTNFNGQSTAIYQPTDEELTCGEKKFVGWTATEDYENATDAPNDLFTTTLPDGVTEGTTFYAVYADTRTTTSITYTWDMVKQSTTPALAAGDQIVITAKNANYALSTTQNTYNRGAVEITKNSNKITIDNKVQIFTLENGNEEGTFALATGNGYLSGTRRKEGRNYYEQLKTETSKASANASWYIGFTEETTPYIYNEVSEKNGKNYEYPNYYVGFNYDYDWWESEYTYYFEAVRDASTWYDYNPENISIYRKTQHTTTTTVNSGYTTDCGCTPPQTPLNIENSTVVVNQTLNLSTITYTGGTGGRISQYYCSDATHTTIAEGHIFSANALGTYEITATQEANNGACETTATFTVTVTCATPSITPPTYETTINTPIDLKSIITSTSPMPLSFAYTGENVYISGTNFTFLAAGSYTITATQAAGGIYCNGSQEITITVTDPCAGKTKPSVTATANETTITVVWDALDDVTTYRVYNNTTGDSDETTETSYTFSGLNPSTEYSWTVEAVYDSDDCTASTSGTTTTSTPVVTYTVNWNVAGGSYNTGTPTTSVNHGDQISSLPTPPDPATYSCDGKVFVGWSKSQFVDGTRPADLFTTAAGSPAITAATTFYAVFADCVTDGGDDTPEDDTQGEWTLVTDVDDLQAGDKIIIACYSKEKAASELTSAILSVDADVTFSNSGNTLTPSASTLIFTLGGSTGAWTFANSSGQLLGATAVKKLAWDGGTTTWRISISGNNATIQNGTDGYGRFLYNVGSPRFTTYTSGTSESMLLPQIYKKTGSGSSETPEPEYTVTLSVLGNIEGTPTTTGEYTLPSIVSGTCAGKTFVGWTTTANLSSSTEPTSDYWAKGTMAPISGDVTLYAVFATESTGGGESSLVKMNANDDFYYGDKIVIIAENTKYGLYQSSSDGYVNYWTTSNASGVPTVAEIEADSKRYFEISEGSASGTIKLGDATNGYLYNSSSTSMSVSKTNYSDWSIIAWDDNTFTFEAGQCLSCRTDITGDNKNKWRGAGSSCDCETNESCSGVIYYNVYKYTSGAGTTYSDYSTTCDGGGETPDPNPDPDPEPTTYTVKWMVNGSQVHSQTSTVGTAITMPSNPADDAIGNCANKFMGWSTFNLGATAGQGAPSDLFTTSPGNITSDITYYAVFATATTSGGGEASATLAFDNTSKRTTFTTTKQVWTENEITFTVDKSNSIVNVNNSADINPIRVYTAAKVTIGYTNNITKIDVTCSSTAYAEVLKKSVGSEASASDTKVTITPTASSKTYIISSFSDQVRMNSLTVYYAASGGSSNTTYSDYVTSCSTGGGDTGGDSGEELTEIITKDNFANSNSTSERSYTAISATWVWQENDVDNDDINTTYAQIRLYAGHSMTITPKSGYSISRIVATCTSNDYATKLAGKGLLGATKEVSSSTVTITPISTPIVITQGAQSRVTQFEVYYTSTPASAPARKVAMKKAAAVRAEKSEMVTRPVVKAPAALAAQECTSYENYTTICCASPITDLKFAAGANSITLYWNTAAASATATLYNDEECTSPVTGATQSGITDGTCTFTGLAKTTTYYAKVTTGDGCTAVLEVSTERPHVSVAEWAAGQINIDVNTNEPITVVLENEVTGGSTSGNQATELFFSKYYEATANVKLVAVYNGTPDAINLTNYTIKYGKTAWASDYITLKDFGATKGQIQPGEEIILYTMNVGDTRDVDIMKCVNEAYPEGTWVQVTTTNNTGKGSLSFGGDKTIALFKGGTMIDIIGGGTASKPDNSGASTKPTWGDAKGWTCDEGLSIDDGTMIGISTNRCLLVRNNTVISGANAVELNENDFVTLCTEWRGAHVPDDDIDDGVSESCENFAFVGTFDYSDYYVKYEELGDPQALDTEGRKEDGTYLITVPTTTYPKGLHDIACTNMRISVKSGDGKTTLVTQDLKVPIIIDQDVQTNNEIYFQYPQRTDVDVKPDLGGDQNENILTPEICADCDVVIRDSKQLTHVAEGVSEFNNMMVYPGAKFDNSTSQEFYLNTLQMQAKNDEVSYAIINNDGSTIDVGDMVFVKRIDDKYWYQFSLPYDCKVSDIIQQDGQSMGKYWVDWGIKYYNGKRRQAEGTAASAGQVSKYWEKVEETATLKAHQGYIIGLFTTEWKNQMKFVYFTPVTTNPYRESGDDAKTTTVNSWYTTPPTTDAPRHHGWNFTGSPYISMFNPQTPPYYGESSVLMSGTFDPDNPDGEYSSGDVYLSIPVLPDGLYYNQVLASSTSLMPFRAYFVQTVDPASADEQHTLTYAKNGRQLSPASAPARAAATKQRVLAELLVTAPDGQTDNTGIWVDERYTTDYEITADLTKMYVAGTKPQLYTIAVDNEKLAYNALPDDAATNVPIELYAPLAGDYTLTLNDRVSRIAGAESIELLHDGQVVANLLIQDYTITANKGTVSGYSLSIRRRADVSTAVDNTTGSTITLIANDEYISLVGVPTDATISIYDMLGRLITSQQANGQSVVNLSIVPQGVYNLVVANGTGYTTIKSVIK